MPPSVNHYMSSRVVTVGKGKYSKNIIQNFPSKEYTRFKKVFKPYLEKIVKEFDWDTAPTKDKHYYMDVEIFFDRTDKDPSNYWKCLLDVGNEIIYVDDRTIVPRVHRVYYTYNEQVPPHIKCTLMPVPYIGIWDSEDEYKEFIALCESCRVYKNGDCGRLKKYLDYKILDDYDWETKTCKAYKEKKSR